MSPVRCAGRYVVVGSNVRIVGLCGARAAGNSAMTGEMHERSDVAEVSSALKKVGVVMGKKTSHLTD